MVKVDNGTADSVFQKMYKFEQTDIDLIVGLLEQELEFVHYNHVYQVENCGGIPGFYEKRDHLESLINEFSKL